MTPNYFRGLEDPRFMISAQHNLAAKRKQPFRPVYKYGGTPVANTRQMARKGLKDNRYNSMIFPNISGRPYMNMTMKGMKNPVFYQGVNNNGTIVDSGIAYPGQDFQVYGDNVYERRLR
jgi:hypothetical protein